MKTTMMMAAAMLAAALSAPVSAADKTMRHDATMADLTASYNVQQSEIQNLRDKGWSWNDIGTALAISKRTSQPLQELVAQKDSGMSWNQIADKGGFRLNEVNNEAKQVAKDFKRAEKQVKRGEGVRGSDQPGGFDRDDNPPSGLRQEPQHQNGVAPFELNQEPEPQSGDQQR